MREEEDGLLRSVLDLAKLKGWLRAHFRPARTKCKRCDGSGVNRLGIDCIYCHGTGDDWRTAVQGDAGYPDLILIRVGRNPTETARLVVAELKSDKGKATPAQQVWLEAYRLIPGIEVYIWRPADWLTIVDILS